MKKLKKKLVITFCLLISILPITAIGIYEFYLNRSVVTAPQGLCYVFSKGGSVTTLSNDLQNHTSFKSSPVFKIIFKLAASSSSVYAGEYFFPQGSSVRDILSKLENNKVLYHTITVVNGWNTWQLLDAMKKNGAIDHASDDMSAGAIAQKIGIKQKFPLMLQQNSLEGTLMPETYYFQRGKSDLELLKWFHQAMQNYLNSQWAGRAKGLYYKNPYQALIVASMIEKETALTREQPIIAAVILNRLKKNMPLQIDSSVIYGLGKLYTGKLTANDLRLKTAYNTYVHRGLPPTPICMPGKGAIHAALHPANTDDIFFVAKDDGSHFFSKTLKEHDAAVQKWQL